MTHTQNHPIRNIIEALAIAGAVVVVLIFLTVAFIHGIERATKRPAICEGLRGWECAEAVAKNVEKNQ